MATTRTKRVTLTFQHSFSLKGVDRQLEGPGGEIGEQRGGAEDGAHGGVVEGHGEQGGHPSGQVLHPGRRPGSEGGARVTPSLDDRRGVTQRAPQRQQAR